MDQESVETKPRCAFDSSLGMTAHWAKCERPVAASITYAFDGFPDRFHQAKACHPHLHMYLKLGWIKSYVLDKLPDPIVDHDSDDEDRTGESYG